MTAHVARMIRKKMDRDAGKGVAQYLELHGLRLRVEYWGLKWYHAKQNRRAGWDDLTVEEFEAEIVAVLDPGEDTLQSWWGLDRASWLVLPRVMMDDMPPGWQAGMGVLLHEFGRAYPNQPDMGTTVRVTVDGRLVPTPPWILNYRCPDRKALDWMRRK